jgi:hypothetical protein
MWKLSAMPARYLQRPGSREDAAPEIKRRPRYKTKGSDNQTLQLFRGVYSAASTKRWRS